MCHLAVDADIILYQAASAAQHVFYDVYAKGKAEQPDFLLRRCEFSKEMKSYIKGMGKGVDDFDVVPVTVYQEPFHAIQICDAMVANILKSVGPSSVTYYLSDDKNFRHELATATAYKVRDKEKPKHYGVVKQHLIEKYKAVVLANLEADDALGIAAAECYADGIPFVQATVDKDLKQIPGMYYNISKETLTTVSYEESLNLYFSQVLTGDSTDTIPGIPGTGPAAAKKQLDGCKTIEDYVARVIEYYEAKIPELIDKGKWVYQKQPLPEPKDVREYLNEQANLLFIRRHRDYGVKL